VIRQEISAPSAHNFRLAANPSGLFVIQPGSNIVLATGLEIRRVAISRFGFRHRRLLSALLPPADSLCARRTDRGNGSLPDKMVVFATSLSPRAEA